MTQPRFEIRRVLYADPRFVRSEAHDHLLDCEVMLEQPGPAVCGEVGTKDGTRFLREARMLARIQHERVVRLREVTEIGGIPTLVLDPPRGLVLTEILATEGRLPPDRVVLLACDLAAGAQAVHAAGQVHRGIAPENIFVDAQGHAALTGFTFAKLFDRRAGRSSIDHGAANAGRRADAGLPTYSAPEQRAGSRSDHRADVFALGCVLYLAVTGQDAHGEMIAENAPSPRQLAPECPRPLDALIRRCIALSPRARFNNMIEVGDAATATAAPPEPSRRLLVTGVALGALVAIGTLVATQLPNVFGSGVQRGRPVVEASPTVDLHYQSKYVKSWALVIGCGYQGNGQGLRELPNAENDAGAVADTLEAIGFEVHRCIGPKATRRHIEDDLNIWLTQAGDDDRVLIYFAGHGEQHLDGSLCLLPSDAGSVTTRSDWLPFASIRPILRNPKGPKHALVVLDCCHADAANQRGLEAGIEGTECQPLNYQDTVTLRSRARWILTAAMSNELAADGRESHSPFTQGLLDALAPVRRGKAVSLFDVYRQIGAAIEECKATQRAWLRDVEGSNTRAEFLFLPKQDA